MHLQAYEFCWRGDKTCADHKEEGASTKRECRGVVREARLHFLCLQCFLELTVRGQGKVVRDHDTLSCVISSCL